MRKAKTIPGKALPWIGGAAGLAYWGIESLVHVAVFGHGTIWDQLLPSDPHEVWTRLLVLALFIGFGTLAGIVIVSENGRGTHCDSCTRDSERNSRNTLTNWNARPENWPGTRSGIGWPRSCTTR